RLDDALNLLANCADVYARCDNANRRLCNQAFFTKIYIDEDDQLRVEKQPTLRNAPRPRDQRQRPHLGLRTTTRPEPKPSKIARVRTLCVG
ncbi:recombinase, partial [Cutibacterium modestum 31N]|nr:recombinase [Cutibacterium modestum 31N]